MTDYTGTGRPPFAPEERARLRSELLERAAMDSRLRGAAITGSAAAGAEDQWSDIDLAFGIRNSDEIPNVVADWTAYMYERHLSLHHLDVRFGNWLYRVFLLPNTLQVDLAFVAAIDFRPLAPSFKLMSGEANEPGYVSPAPAGNIIGLAWLYALHARSCIARGRLWQAEYMISGIRDNALALCCIRHGLPAVHGRGLDQLPIAAASKFEGTLVRNLDPAELSRAFRVSVQGLLDEIRSADEGLADKLQTVLMLLTETES
jgi:hypothetical protein